MALVSSAQICIASNPEVPLTASPPVSGMLNPTVIGCPDGPAARTGSGSVNKTDTAAATADNAKLHRGFIRILRNIFLPGLL